MSGGGGGGGSDGGAACELHQQEKLQQIDND